MKFWIAFSFTDTTHLIPMAQRAEEVGFEGVFLADHLCVPAKIESRYPYSGEGAPPFSPRIHHPDVWATISAMATATRTLRFSIGTHILPLHDPLEVARGAATAAVFAGSRMHISVGVGWMKEEFEIQGIDFHTRGRRTDEMIEVMRKLWTGEVVEHHGEFFDFPPLTMLPAPASPIPILIAGLSPRALRRTAEGDRAQLEGALCEFQVALELDLPQRAGALFGRAFCLNALAREPVKVKDLLTEALEEDPDLEEARRLLDSLEEGS